MSINRPVSETTETKGVVVPQRPARARKALPDTLVAATVDEEGYCDDATVVVLLRRGNEPALVRDLPTTGVSANHAQAVLPCVERVGALCTFGNRCITGRAMRPKGTGARIVRRR